MSIDTQRELARKAFYAAIGAPVVAGRLAKEYADKLASQGSKLTDSAQNRFEELSKEGEKVAKQLRDADMVEELQSRVDFDKVQHRVEKMRDQLEDALEGWRESFSPAAKPTAAKSAAKKAPASKPAAKKPSTGTASAKKAPASKPAAKRTATAGRTTTAKKAPAKKVQAKKATTAKK